MSLTLQTNIASVTTQRWLNVSSANQTEELAKLSSGNKITKAADDAAGLAISTKLTIKVVSLNKAIDNGNQGVAMLQTAEGGLSTISDILTRLKELATEAASANNATDRGSLQLERAKLEAQITNIALGTKYGATQLLAGTADSTTVAVQGGGLTVANGITSISGTSSGNYQITASANAFNSALVDLKVASFSGESQTITVAVPTEDNTQNVSFSQFGLTIEINRNLSTIGATTGAPTNAPVTLADGPTFGNMAGSIDINGTTIDLSSVNSMQSLVEAINTKSATTGVSADITANGFLSLTSASETVNSTIDFNNLTTGGLGTFAGTANGVITITAAGVGAGAATVNAADDATFGKMGGSLVVDGSVAGYDTIDLSNVNSNATLVAALTGNLAGGTITATAGNGALILTPTNATQGILFDESGVTTGSLGFSAAQKAALAGNTIAVTSDGATTTFTFQLGDTSASYNKVTATIGGVDLTGLGLAGLNAWADNDDGTAEDLYLDAINSAIDVVNDQRASIGSFQSQIGYQVSNLTITVENTQAANSTIKDTDYAASYSEYTKYSVMSQADVAMLAQANQIPQQILTLLRG